MRTRRGGLRLVDGRIWIRPARRLLWWRPFARLEAEGLVLVPRGGPERLLPWAGEWSFYFSEGFHSPSQLVVTVDGASCTLSGWYWSELPARPITALMEFLRLHPESGVRLADPIVAAQLARELAECRPTWKGRSGLRWLLGGYLDERVEDELARIGGLRRWRRCPSGPGSPSTPARSPAPSSPRCRRSIRARSRSTRSRGG